MIRVIFLLCSLLVAACSKSDIDTIQGLTLQATTTSTRSSFDGVHSHWSDGDKLQAIVSQGGAGAVHRFSMLDASKSSFVNQDIIINRTARYDIYALHTAQNIIPNANGINADVPIGAAVQQQVGSSPNHIAALDPLYGKAENVSGSAVSVNMQHSAVALSINIRNTTTETIAGIQSLQIIAPNDVEIYGWYRLNLATSEIELVNGGGNSITVNVSSSESIAVGESFTIWAAAAPFVIPKDEALLFKVTTTDGKVLSYEKIFTEQVAFETGTIMQTTIEPILPPEEIVLKWGYLNGYITPVLVSGGTGTSLPKRFSCGDYFINIDGECDFSIVNNEFMHFANVNRDTEGVYIYLPQIANYKLKQVITHITQECTQRNTLRVGVGIGTPNINDYYTTINKNTTFDISNSTSSEQYNIHIKYKNNQSNHAYDLTGITMVYKLEK